MSAAGQTLLARTIGIRAAGTAGGVVLLAGPGLAGGLNVFAFNAATRGFVGATSLPAYNNVRKFLVVNGVLYAGVGLPNPTASPSLKTGRILRWDLSGAFPYAVTEVGQVDSAASELALHEGRLFVTTWPDAELTSGKLAGLFMSPPLHGAGPGLDAGDAASWTRVWVASDYEPDPVTARSYGGGALASFGGYLFWGTMHVPLVSTELHAAAYPADFPSTTAGQVDWFVKSERAISLFRGRAFGTASQAIDLAYGLPSLPVYVPGSPGSWQTLPNGMGGAAPLFGVPGMGNPFNNYTWTMSVYDGRLWVGTMDWSYLFGELFSTFFPGAATPSVYGGASALRGADLWNFVSPSCPAVPENLDGICNVSSYGIRTMGADASGLLLGMANPMNLLASGSGPQGGWELIRLVAREPNTPVGQGVTVPTDVASVLLCNVTRAGTTYFQQLPVPTTLPVPASLLPSPYTRILAAYVFGSSAALATCGGQASPPGYGSFSVPRLNPAPTRLYALDSTGSSGPAWRDITTGETESTLSGTIPAPGAVILQVADASSAIPALGVPGALALALLLAAAGALALRRLG